MSQLITISGDYTEPTIGVSCPSCNWTADVSLRTFVLAINHTQTWKCLDCGCEFKIEFVRLTRVAELRDGAVQPQHDLGRTSRLIQMVNSLGNIIVESYGKGYIAENDLNQANDYLDFVIPLLPKS